MLILIGLKEQSLRAMYAGTRLALSAQSRFDDLMLSSDSDPKDSDGRGDNVPSKNVECSRVDMMGVGASEWLRQFTTQVPESVKPAVEWVNAVFGTQPASSGFDDSMYEVRTVIQGCTRFAELRNPLSRALEELTDESCLATNPMSPRTANMGFAQTQTRNTNTVVDSEIQGIVDLENFRQQVLQSFDQQLRQLDTSNHSTTVLQIEHDFSDVKVFDGQGRVWHSMWHVRTCLAEAGAFLHSARRLHSFTPGCDRSAAMLAHFETLVKSSKQLPQLTPVVVSIGDSHSSDTAGAEPRISEAMREELADLLDIYFDVEDLEWTELPKQAIVQIPTNEGANDSL